jgi:hypothetical protein
VEAFLALLDLEERAASVEPRLLVEVALVELQPSLEGVALLEASLEGEPSLEEALLEASLEGVASVEPT